MEDTDYPLPSLQEHPNLYVFYEGMWFLLCNLMNLGILLFFFKFLSEFDYDIIVFFNVYYQFIWSKKTKVWKMGVWFIFKEKKKGKGCQQNILNNEKKHVKNINIFFLKLWIFLFFILKKSPSLIIFKDINDIWVLLLFYENLFQFGLRLKIRRQRHLSLFIPENSCLIQPRTAGIPCQIIPELAERNIHWNIR